jgi:CubicO group peptidase (beta-lactamase class C family)
MIVSPGRIWSEPGDGGFSRASFPFVLTNRIANDSHNGIATFLYDGHRVSSLRIQIVQEEAPWAKVDYWGQSPVTYEPGEIDNRNILSVRLADELKQQTPISPWSALVDKSASPIVANFPHSSGKTEDISFSGLIVDDVIYAHPCHTRFGDYPYCRYMRHGAFSVTKSMGAALTMFRLAQKYGDGIFDLKIKDYVRVTADHDGWHEVTFGDALNMATGVGYASPERALVEIDADEASPPFGDNPSFGKWLRAPSAHEKLSIAFSIGDNYPWGPGEVARYDTMHTFILAAAMDGFLKRKEGPNADLWDMMIEDVLRPIGVFHAPIMRTVEPDGATGIPVMRYGLYPTIDEVAKISRLLQNGGRHQGRQLLSGPMVDKALYRTQTRGLPTGWQTPHGQYEYHMSFWLMPFVTKDACEVWIPNMIGHGGNYVLLLPNGMTAFRFADHYDYDASDLVEVGNAVRPLCAP